MLKNHKLINFTEKKNLNLVERKFISDLVNKLEDEEFMVLKKINKILSMVSTNISKMTRPTNEEIINICNIMGTIKGYLLEIIEELGISDNEKLETVKLLLSSSKQILFDLQTLLQNRVNSKAFKKDTIDATKSEYTKQLSKHIEDNIKSIEETNKFVDNIINKFMELKRSISIGKFSLSES